MYAFCLLPYSRSQVNIKISSFENIGYIILVWHPFMTIWKISLKGTHFLSSSYFLQSLICYLLTYYYLSTIYGPAMYMYSSKSSKTFPWNHTWRRSTGSKFAIWSFFFRNLSFYFKIDLVIWGILGFKDSCIHDIDDSNYIHIHTFSSNYFFKSISDDLPGKTTIQKLGPRKLTFPFPAILCH